MTIARSHTSLKWKFLYTDADDMGTQQRKQFKALFTFYNQLINMCEYIYAYVIFAIYMQGHTFEPLICV